MKLKFVYKFIQLESTSGIVLFVAAIIALLLANSPWHDFYNYFFNAAIHLKWLHWTLKINLNQIINDGLMAIFFLLVSLEIKRELLIGELNSSKKAILPLCAAIGGIILPALIYVLFNYDQPIHLRGWAIPTATDIAFSLGLLTLLGNRVPVTLKIFLTALAILDDLAAIIIIAVFYTNHIIFYYLFLALSSVLVLLILNYFKYRSFWLYGIFGLLLWFFTLKSGIHATLAGVILGIIIPLENNFEKNLHPWVAFIILPLFALANAGLNFSDIQSGGWLNPIFLAITLGLFIGKQVGVFSFAWFAIKTGIAQMPNQITWRQFYGVSLLCGIGFTMSLFIGALAFPDETLHFSEWIRLGVLTGSILSGIMGYLLLRY